MAKCAGPLQCGVGRPDGENTMIKTIQYLAEADSSRVLVALDLKAAFQNVSRRAMLYSIEQNDADLAAVFSKWYTGTTEHKMHYESAHTTISANSGVDQGCPLSTCGFSAAIDPILRSLLAEICRQYDTGGKLFAYLNNWYLWFKPLCLLPTFALITAATTSANLELQLSRGPRARTQVLLSYKTRSDSHKAAWVGIFKSMETLNRALLSWASMPPWRKQHNALNELPLHLHSSTPKDSMHNQSMTYSPCTLVQQVSICFA